MQLLIQKIEAKNSWGKKELSIILANTAKKYQNIVLVKQCDLNSPENTKENINSDVCLFVLGQIQSRTSWGKNEVKEIIFKKLIEELTC